jgi:ketosteroid isomerase-like protein
MNLASRLQIEQCCERLIRMYCNAMDDHNADAVAALFAADGEWFRQNNPPLTGTDAIRTFAATHQQDAISVHYTTNVVVDVIDETHARSRAYALSFREKGTAADLPLVLTQPKNIVRYEHEFVAVGGDWKIRRMHTRWIFKR